MTQTICNFTGITFSRFSSTYSYVYWLIYYSAAVLVGLLGTLRKLLVRIYKITGKVFCNRISMGL